MRTLAVDGLPKDQAYSEDMAMRLRDCWRAEGIGPRLWFTRERAEFIGYCGLRRIALRGEVFTELLYALLPDVWRKGFGTEAAAASLAEAREYFPDHSFTAWTLPHNIASRRLMERVGFRYERDFEYAGLPHVFYRLPDGRRGGEQAAS